MAIENSVSNDFLSTFVDSINVFDCRLPCVNMVVSSFRFYFLFQPVKLNLSDIKFYKNTINLYFVSYQKNKVLHQVQSYLPILAPLIKSQVKE